MGHIFGLTHTYYCEHVTRYDASLDYNAPCAGDRVVDTNAASNFRDDFTNFSDGVD
ncbi:hypothetical protein [Mesonia aestuariivivens]|uniref:Peptidase M10 metallopeptidase domain-containing protein n=1 Tax=Mesonia aestuariivivens TaxID=2796128 RepID=A0ABS6W078_9FLAO|nr:hypothetical protein [Mesonia aestuariivivens]MBW2960962.1 hypothetical protein [Mesonia aestuariivivens]